MIEVLTPFPRTKWPLLCPWQQRAAGAWYCFVIEKRWQTSHTKNKEQACQTRAVLSWHWRPRRRRLQRLSSSTTMWPFWTATELLGWRRARTRGGKLARVCNVPVQEIFEIVEIKRSSTSFIVERRRWGQVIWPNDQLTEGRKMSWDSHHANSPIREWLRLCCEDTNY